MKERDDPRLTTPARPGAERPLSSDPARADHVAPEPLGAPDGPPAEVSDDIVTPARGDVPVARGPRRPAGDEKFPELATRTYDRDSRPPGAPGMREAGTEQPGSAIGPDGDRGAEPHRAPAGPTGDLGSAAGSAGKHGSASADVPLIDPSEAERLRLRWRDIQTGFVDDPAVAVTAADEIVNETIGVLSAELQRRAVALREAAHREGPADTEEMRLALRGYRSMMDRLLD